MNNWNQLLRLLDKTLGFPNRVSSTVKKTKESYDNQRKEHVIWLEYRIKTSNDAPSDSRRQPAKRDMTRLKQIAQAIQARRGQQVTK